MMQATANADGTVYMPGVASLIQDLNKKVMVVLRDDRSLIGILKNIDQFGNLVLINAIERLVVDHKYHDVERGIFLVRGENVAFVGQTDDGRKRTRHPSNMEKVSMDDIIKLQRKHQIMKDAKEKAEQKVFYRHKRIPNSLNPMNEDTFN
ncbi:hypothetical protein ACOME3_009649 [Neoechinorhynchus agilis]